MAAGKPLYYAKEALKERILRRGGKMPSNTERKRRELTGGEGSSRGRVSEGLIVVSSAPGILLGRSSVSWENATEKTGPGKDRGWREVPPTRRRFGTTHPQRFSIFLKRHWGFISWYPGKSSLFLVDPCFHFFGRNLQFKGCARRSWDSL